MPLEKNLNTLIILRDITLLYLMNVMKNKAFKNISFIKERTGPPSLIYHVAISANTRTDSGGVNRRAAPGHGARQRRAGDTLKCACG